MPSGSQTESQSAIKHPHRASDERGQLVVVPDQNKHVGATKGRQDHRLRDLPGLVHDTVVETPVREQRMLHPQAGAPDNPGKAFAQPREAGGGSFTVGMVEHTTLVRCGEMFFFSFSCSGKYPPFFCFPFRRYKHDLSFSTQPFQRKYCIDDGDPSYVC